MRWSALLLALFGILVTTPFLVADGPLTNEDVVLLAKLNLGDDVVVAKIRQSAAVAFKLDTVDLARLKSEGVSPKVIEAMLLRATASPQTTAAAAPAGPDVPKTALPQELGVVYMIEGDRLVEMERNVPSMKNRGTGKAILSAVATAGIYMSRMQMVISMGGGRSPVRTGSVRPTFVVRTAAGYDPTKIDLVPFETRSGDTRESAMGSAGGWLGVQVSSEQGYPTIPANVMPSKDDPNVVYLKPGVDLVPGEYAWTAAGSREAFCFGLDLGPDSGPSPFDRDLELKRDEVLPLGISHRGMTVTSAKIIRWPTEADLRKAEQNAEAMGEIVVVFNQTNQSGADYKCTYDLVLMDNDGLEIGKGHRVVGIERGEVDDTARVGIRLRLADLNRAARLRVRAVPSPDL